MRGRTGRAVIWRSGGGPAPGGAQSGRPRGWRGLKGEFWGWCLVPGRQYVCATRGAATGGNRRRSTYQLERCTPYGVVVVPSAATESRVAPTPRRSRALRASQAAPRSRSLLMWAYHPDCSAMGTPSRYRTRPDPRATVPPGVTMPAGSAADSETSSRDVARRRTVPLGPGLAGLDLFPARSIPGHLTTSARRSFTRSE
jgi:hypothetical protein